MASGPTDQDILNDSEVAKTSEKNQPDSEQNDGQNPATDDNDQAGDQYGAGDESGHLGGSSSVFDDEPLAVVEEDIVVDDYDDMDLPTDEEDETTPMDEGTA